MAGTILDRLGVVFDPRFWIRNDPVNHEWSDHIEAMLDRGWKPVLSHCTSKMGGGEIWLENWPYAYGSPYCCGRDNMLPRRRTAIRLRKATKNNDASEAIARCS